MLLLAASGNGARPRPTPQASPETSRDPHRAALETLHRRAQSASPGSPESRRLSVQFAEMGRVYLEGGEPGRAIELLDEACALDDSNGMALAELTLAYVRVEDYEAAAFHLRLAQEKANRSAPEIYAVLGEIYDGLHRLPDAVAAWGEAVRQGGQNPILLRRLARARDELAIVRGERSVASDNFMVFAEPAVSDAIVQRAVEELERAHRAQAAFFGTGLTRRQIVVLHGGRAYFALASVPDWGSWVYDGKIRVSVRPDAEDANALSAVLAHELAHALMRQVSRDGSPGWLHEGLAQWLEGRRIPLRELNREIGPRPARSIEALEGGFGVALDRAHARSLYAQSLSIVEYLAAIRGEGTLACIVTSAGNGASFLEVLESEAGLTPSELFARWKAWAGV